MPFLKIKHQWSRLIVAALLISSFLLLPAPAKAQTSQKDDPMVSQSLLRKVTVTARKKEEALQDVPLSISYIGGEQIEDQQVRDLTSLAVSMPNVALDEVGTVKGIANFSIRGLGINSSIPSIDPAVGIFIDGVYMGLNPSALFDTFDMESIEVLRGPQGNLFGRNVSAGAVLLNTKKPGDRLEFSFRSVVEGGGEKPNAYLTTSFGGPLSETLGVRFSVYTNQDGGYFKNLNTGNEFGELDTIMFRPVVAWNPTENISLVTRYEYQDINGDGPPAQSIVGPDNLREGDIRGRRDAEGHPLSSSYYDFNSFDFSIDEEGFRKSKNHFLNARADWNIDFGEGTVTNIFSWFDTKGSALIDLDASPQDITRVFAWYDAYQISNELRYTGRFFDRLHLTSGLYYYSNDTSYHERRLALGDKVTGLASTFSSLPPAVAASQLQTLLIGGLSPAELQGLLASQGLSAEQLQQVLLSVVNGLQSGTVTSLALNGGGEYDLRSLGMFLSMDYDITSKMTLVAGTRYTNEKKKAKVTYLPGAGASEIFSIVNSTLSSCNIVEGPDCDFDFRDSKTWNDLSPKVGLLYQLMDAANLYGHWARGVRSGGYNVRHTRNNNPNTNFSTLRPYDTETVDSFEVGLKSYGQRAHLNGAFFYNRISDVQQVVAIVDEASSVLQTIANVGDAESFGFELDGQFALNRNLILLGTLGYIDQKYTKATFDLNGDAVVDDKDKDLEFPRAPKWTYSLGMLLNAKLGNWGGIGSRVNYAYRSKSFLTENNEGVLSSQNIIDAGLRLYPSEGKWSLGVYGKNLLDEVRYAGHSFLPAQLLPDIAPLATQLGGTFSTLSKGRVYGLELRYKL